MDGDGISVQNEPIDKGNWPTSTTSLFKAIQIRFAIWLQNGRRVTLVLIRSHMFLTRQSTNACITCFIPAQTNLAGCLIVRLPAEWSWSWLSSWSRTPSTRPGWRARPIPRPPSCSRLAEATAAASSSTISERRITGSDTTLPRSAAHGFPHFLFPTVSPFLLCAEESG